jgi:hypothetical protein
VFVVNLRLTVTSCVRRAYQLIESRVVAKDFGVYVHESQVLSGFRLSDHGVDLLLKRCGAWLALQVKTLTESGDCDANLHNGRHILELCVHLDIAFGRLTLPCLSPSIRLLLLRQASTV